MSFELRREEKLEDTKFFMTQPPRRDGSHTSKRTSTPGLVISSLSTFTRRCNSFVPIVSRIFPKLVLHVAVHVLLFLSVLGVADADPIASSSSHPNGSCVRGSSSVSSVSGGAAFVSYSDLWTSDRPKPASINIHIPSQRYDRACFSTSSTLNLKKRPDIISCTSTRTDLFRNRSRNREISKRTFASNGCSNGCDYGFNGFNWFKKNEHNGRFAFPMFSTRLGASANADVDVDLETTLKTVAKKKVKRKRKASIQKKNGATISATTNTITQDDDAPTIKKKKKKKTKRKTRTAVAKKRSTSTAVRKKATAKKKKSKRSRSSRKIKDEPVHFFRNETDAITILNYNHNHDLDIDQSKFSTPTVVKFKVRGNPVPLARHRTYRGFVFNPSAKKQKQFCNVVLDMLPFCHFNGNESAIIVGNGGSDSADTSDKGINAIGIDTDTNIDIDVNKNNMNVDTNIDISKGTENVIPIFGEQEVISVQIICRMKRPQKHFVGGKPERGRLRKPKPASEDGEKGDKDKQAPHVASHLQVTRTDVDNLAKFVLDALNGVLYADDRQVASLTVTKVYDDEEPYVGSTDVCIKSLTLEDLSLNGVLDGEG